MPVKPDAEVEALRLQSEINRAALTNSVRELKGKVSDTVDEFRERVSPTHIKQEIREYVREGSQSFVQSLEQKARDNPLQAVAVGAAIAYPLFGILRAIPAPLMLMGAGLWFAGKSGRKTLSQVRTKAADIAGRTSDDIAEFAGAARQTAGDRADQVSQTIAARGAAVTGRVSDMADQVKATAANLGNTAVEFGQSTLDTATARASAASDAVSDVASEMKNKVVAAGTQSRDTVLAFVDRNPLLVGGVGLAIGAFIASSLPASDVENRYLGERSDDLKQKAREYASDGMSHARGVAAGVAGEMAMAAAREGLNSDGVKKVVEGVTQRVAAVANRGLNTALGEEAPLAPAAATSQAYKAYGENNE